MTPANSNPIQQHQPLEGPEMWMRLPPIYDIHETLWKAPDCVHRITVIRWN